MTWRDHIHSDPEILGGKPVVQGTRLAVDFLLRAVFAYASETIHDETYYPVDQGAP